MRRTEKKMRDEKNCGFFPGRMVMGGIISLMSVFLFSPLFAAETLRLEDAIAEALSRNPDIQVARGEEEISSNNVHIGNAGLLPRIDLAGTVSYQDNEEALSTGLREFTSTSASLQASYTLFDGFGNIYTFKKLKSAGRLGRLGARNAIEGIILRVAEAYYRLADASAALDVAREALAISEERLKRARLRSDYGQANSLEVLSATVDANADSVAWKEASLARSNANRTLNLLLNRPVEAEYSIESAVVFERELKADAFLQKARQVYSEYLSARESVKQAEYDLAIARSDFFPELGVQAGYGYSNTVEGFKPGTDDLSGAFSAALTLNLNLFNGFQSSIRSQNARISLRNKKLLEQKALSDLEKLVADTWDEYRNALDIFDFQKKNQETAELNFRRSKELYVLGQLTSTAFREAQLNLINAKKSISSAAYNARILELRLKRLSGSLVKEEDVVGEVTSDE